MQELVDAHRETSRLINFGSSAEGRDILGLTISTGDDKSEEFNGGKKEEKGAEEAGEVWLPDPRRPTCTRGTLVPVL